MSGRHATVWVVERQHSGLTPDWWELVAVCADEATARLMVAADTARRGWGDEDDYRSHEQRVLTSVPEAMRG